METAKVDIKKLQLLNDRINQCIDALNQVRLSVHGLSHTAGINAGISSMPSAPIDPRLDPRLDPRFDPRFTSAYTPYANPFSTVGPQIGAYPGISHTAAGFNVNPLANQFSPFTGLSHTSPESMESYGRPTWADPYLAARVTQTFPYLQFSLPPVVPIF